MGLYNAFESPYPDWAYNALDCMATLEIWTKIKPQLDARSALAYNFEMALRGPALEMMLRGIRVDLTRRETVRRKLTADATRLRGILDRYVPGLNPNSPKQLKEYFYTTLALPHQYKFDHGSRSLSCDRTALEKLSLRLYARPVTLCILACRDVSKKLSVVNCKLDSDNRFRSSYNSAGTETGRFSSSASAFRTGSNAQNIPDELRQMFIPDKGMKLGYADLEQAESRAVAYISNDAAYIAACESGDLHTKVAQMVWSDKAWGSHPRAVADQLFYRTFSYRDIAKRLGHATNYHGTAAELAKRLHLPKPLVERFQLAYFTAFSGIPDWHNKVASELHATSSITTYIGRKRRFLSRAYDAATLREAIAYNPQSTVADILNLGLYRLWQETLKGEPLQILAQIHDAVLFQYPATVEAALLPRVAKLLTVPVGPMTIPCEIGVGWNWAHWSKDDNPDGIKPWRGLDARTKTSLLDRLVC